MVVERDFKPVEKGNKYYIQYKSYDSYMGKWRTHKFSDFLGNLLYFYSKKDALDWIEARNSIINS